MGKMGIGKIVKIVKNREKEGEIRNNFHGICGNTGKPFWYHALFLPRFSNKRERSLILPRRDQLCLNVSGCYSYTEFVKWTNSRSPSASLKGPFSEIILSTILSTDIFTLPATIMYNNTDFLKLL